MRKYLAFISYKHDARGRLVATALENSIKSYAHSPYKRFPNIFRDEKFLVPNGDLSLQIENALKSSSFLIFIANPASSASEWCQKEIKYWLELGNAIDTIIIVKTDGEIIEANSFINWDLTTALPSFLRSYFYNVPYYIDFSKLTKSEHFNVQNIVYNRAINAISAKLRGVDPQELNDIHLFNVKKNKRLRIYAIISLALISVIALIFGVTAQLRKQNLQIQLNISKANELAAIARTNFQKDPTLSLKQLNEANNYYQTKEVHSAYHDLLAISGLNLYRVVDTVEIDTFLSSDFSKNSEYFLHSSSSINSKIWEPNFDFYYVAGYKDDSTAVLLNNISGDSICSCKHTAIVSHVEFITDSIFLTADYGGNIKIWSKSCQLIFDNKIIDDKITTANVGLGKRVYFGTLTGDYGYADYQTGKTVILGQQSTKITQIDFYKKNGNYLFGDRYGNILLFDNNDNLKELSIHNDDVTIAKFVDEDLIVTSGSDNKIIISDINTQEDVYTCLGNDYDIIHIDVDIKSRSLNSIDEKGIVKVWYLDAVIENKLDNLFYEDEDYEAALILDDNKIIYGTSFGVLMASHEGEKIDSFLIDEYDGFVSNFDTLQGQIVIGGYIDTTYKLNSSLEVLNIFPHEEDESIFISKFVRDSLLITGGDYSIKLWNHYTGSLLDSIPSVNEELITDIEEVPNSSMVLISDLSGALRMYDINQNKFNLMDSLIIEDGIIYDLLMVSKKDLIIGGDSLYRVDVSNLSITHTYKPFSPINSRTGVVSDVYSVSRVNEENKILICQGDASLRLIDFDGNLFQSFQMYDIAWTTSAFNDGEKILVYSLSNDPLVLRTIHGLTNLIQD